MLICFQFKGTKKYNLLCKTLRNYMSNKNVDDLIQMMNSILQNVNKEKKDEIMSGK